jgi:hypothetical protein
VIIAGVLVELPHELYRLAAPQSLRSTLTAILAHPEQNRPASPAGINPQTGRHRLLMQTAGSLCGL